MTWLSREETAILQKITPQAVSQNAQSGKYGDGIRHIPGKGRGGRQLQVALSALPENAQQKYLVETLNQNAVDLCKPINRPFDNCNETQKANAIQKYKAIEAYKVYEREQVEKNPQFSRTQCKTDFIENWNKNNSYQLTQTTFYRMLKDYKSEGITGLIDSRGGYNKNRSSIPDEIWELFKSMYLSQTQPSIHQCFNDVRLLATERGIAIPGYHVFKYQVKKSITQSEIILGRYGKKAYSDLCDPTLDRDYSLLRSNQIWVADGHIWDVFVKVIENGEATVKAIRLWGVYWMDMCSRKMLSFRVCVGNPNADTVLLAFRAAVLEYGIPEEVILDNGKDYKTKDLFNTKKYEQLKIEMDTRFNIAELFDKKADAKFLVTPIASQMGIKVHFCNPYNAKSKPIERAFGTFEGQFSKRFSSYLGRNTINRPEQLKKMPLDKFPSTDEFIKLHDKFILKIYNDAEHNGVDMNGKTPNQLYKERLGEINRSTPEVMRLWLMRTTQAYKVGKSGINIKGTRYYTTEFVNLTKENRKVYARYDPEDMSYVEIYDLQDKYMYRAERLEKMPFNASKEEYEAMNRIKKEAYKKTKEGIPEPPEGYGSVDFINKMLELQIAENRRKGLFERTPEVPVKLVRNSILEENARKSKAMRDDNSTELFAIKVEEALKLDTVSYDEAEFERQRDLMSEYFKMCKEG